MSNIFLLAKKIRKANPKMKWPNAVKEAGKQMKVGAYKVIEKGENKSTPVKKVVQTKRTKEGRFQGYKKVSGKIGVRVGNLPKYYDEVAAREISLFADTDGKLYNNYRRPILVSLSRKHKAGTFTIEKGADAFMPYIEAAMKQYQREFGNPRKSWTTLLNINDRKLLAKEYAEAANIEFNLGNYLA